MDIYINNKYTNIYYRIVNKAISEKRKRNKDKIYENHHIIPKSCGGPDTNDNLVLLAPKEHYICHVLLPKMVHNRFHYEKMIYALWSLINGNGRSERYSTNGSVYQKIKEEQSIIRSNNMKGSKNHFYGKTHSEEFKRNMSENNPSSREEVKEKLRGPRPNFKPHCYYFGVSEVTKEKLKIANLGKIHSEESRKKMSISRSKCIWVKKENEKSKHINFDDLDYYLFNGWIRGRHLNKQNKSRNSLNKDQKENLRKILSLKIWICKMNEKSKFINITDLNSYTELGWIRGRKISVHSI